MKGFLLPSDLRSVVCVGAHADDIEIGAGGTIAAIASAQPASRFVFIVLSADTRRRAEAVESAKALLGDRVDVRVGGFEDSYLPYRDPAGVKDFLKASVPRETDLVIGPNRHDAHQDHRFAAQLIGQVCRDQPVLGYEIVKYDGDLGRPNLYFGLSEAAVASKTTHLVAHFSSQEAKPWFHDRTFVGIMRLRGIEANAPEGYAEAFYSTKLVFDLAS